MHRFALWCCSVPVVTTIPSLISSFRLASAAFSDGDVRSNSILSSDVVALSLTCCCFRNCITSNLESFGNVVKRLCVFCGCSLSAVNRSPSSINLTSCILSVCAVMYRYVYSLRLFKHTSDFHLLFPNMEFAINANANRTKTSAGLIADRFKGDAFKQLCLIQGV